MTIDWKRRGTAHVLGDNVPHDGAIMAFDIVIARTTDPEKLIPHLFAELDPSLIDRIQPGDVIVAGRNFLTGKAHNAGIIAFKALGLSILCESMPVRAFQGVVALSVPVLISPQLAGLVADGDEVDVDFATGRVENVSRGEARMLDPMVPEIRQMMEAGGARGALAAHLEKHPELREPLA